MDNKHAELYIASPQRPNRSPMRLILALKDG